MIAQGIFPVADSSHVATARAALGELMARCGFDPTRAGRGSLVLTEAATNILKHAGEGTVMIRPFHCDGDHGVEVLALDNGPGIADWGESSADGTSTAGTPGTGLGAMRRLSDHFDAYSRVSKGTVVRMSIWCGDEAAGKPRRYELGAVCVPLKGEEVSGDSWGAAVHAEGVTVMVADGLGHGLQAHDASQAAVAVLEKHPTDGSSALLQATHGALRATRGAALAVARCNFHRREIAYAGAGNISGVLVRSGHRRQMISHAGIVGHKVHSTRELTYPWPADELLVMHSDGLETHWNLDAYPGLLERHPALIAGVLYRDFKRARDDVSVVVLRTPGRP
jgi:anti-sigma regulatory factor (Ser/Thr protein kinase)